MITATDPSTWSKAQVKEWLTGVESEYSLKDLDHQKFATTDGYKLCQMTMRDFCRLTEKANAEIILNQLSQLKQSESQLLLCLRCFTGKYFFQ